MRIAVIGAVMEDPLETQHDFNDIISEFQGNVRGRMGIPFHEEGVSVISLTVVGTLDDINGLTGKLGNLKGVTVKTSISKKEI